MRKALSALLAAITLFFSACSAQSPESATGTGSATTQDGPAVTGAAAPLALQGELRQMQSSYMGVQAGGSYYQLVQRTGGKRLLLATDMEAGTQAPACHMAGCNHDGDDCPALLPAGGDTYGSLLALDDALYYVYTVSPHSGATGESMIFSLLPGEGRQLLATLAPGQELVPPYFSDGSHILCQVMATRQRGEEYDTTMHMVGISLAGGGIQQIEGAPSLAWNQDGASWSFFGALGQELLFSKLDMGGPMPEDPATADFTTDEEWDAYYASEAYSQFEKQLQKYWDEAKMEMEAFSPQSGQTRTLFAKAGSNYSYSQQVVNGAAHYVLGEGGSGVNLRLVKLDLATGNETVLADSLPGTGWFLYNYIDGYFFADYTDDPNSGSMKTHYGVVNAATGEVLAPPLAAPVQQLPADSYDPEPLMIAAVQGENYLVVTSHTEFPVSITYGDGQTSDYTDTLPRFSLISKADYWAGNANYTPIEGWPL